MKNKVLRRRRSLSCLGAVALAIIVCVTGIRIWQKYDAMIQRQIFTLERMKRLSDGLERYERSRGEFPPTLETVGEFLHPDLLDAWGGRYIDAWNQTFIYYTTPSGYVLLSPGKDGEVDARPIVTTIPDEPRQICGDWSADQILTNDGWVAACYKP